ncbi:MAG: helix-turn-helix transcriptional regulator [Clostridia bacterium]|nr:helix-turn-helix transcriptional regulator [Clostridia bacterium]
MKTPSSEALSNEYLHVNSCGCEHLYGQNVGSLRPDGRIDYHLLYISEGCCYVTENGQEIPAPTGSVIVYLPRERQEYKFRADVNSTSYFIHFTGTACEELLQKLHLDSGRIFLVGKSRRIENALNHLIDEFHLKLPFYESPCHGHLLVVLSLIARRMAHSQSVTELRSRKLIEESCRYMYANYSKNITITEYARMCNLSESRFSHLFKEHTGLTPIQYILNIKIQRAKELLENTDLPILQISEIIGMQSQNYFSRIFKKHTGLSPLKYRNPERK